MGCCGGERENWGDLNAEQKWEYINLDDFKSSSCWTPFAYIYLVVMLIVSISVYAVDTFTAINLLAFDKWAGQIKPVIPLNISRWIFAGCIILSFVLLTYRWMRAVKVMRQGGVAKSYLDPLAVRVQSIRWGRARGWKRFLVFAELTKSRKGADYVALFTYFSFEAWLRIVFAEGPRQVVNAITLYSVLRLKLVPKGENAPKDGHSPVVQFFVNVGVLAEENHLQAVILFGMLWTLFIWVISVLSLIISIVLYLVFLWHHIPNGDGLSRYCRSKINRRMERIVKVKVDKALKRENQLRAREEAKAARQGLEGKKQPTLPNITAELDSLPGLSRTTTMTTLPEYTSRPGTGRNSDESIPTLPALPDIPTRPPMPTRAGTHNTNASWSSYSSNAPLMATAGDMGYAPDHVHTPGAESTGPWAGKPMGPNRSMTGISQFSQRSYSPAPGRPGTAQGDRNGPAYQMDPLPRTGTGMSNRRVPSDSSALPYPEDRGSTPGQAPSWPGANYDSPVDAMGRRMPPAVAAPSFSGVAEERGRMSPGPGPQFRSQTPTGGLHYRSQTPTGRPPPRSYTPNGGPPRSITPSGPPERVFTPNSGPVRAITPSGGPLLPRLQTQATTGYIPYSAEPRPMTPVSSSIPPSATIRTVTEPSRTYTPFGPTELPNDPSSRRPPAPQRQGSEVNDILDHY